MAGVQTFGVDTELSPAYQDGILRFIREYYLLVRPKVFGDVRFGKEDGVPSLAFSVFGPDGRWRIDAILLTGNPIKVRFVPVGEVPPSTIETLREDLFIEVQRYEEIVRTTTLYFAWVKGQTLIPERPPSGSRRAMNRTFTGGMLLLQTLLLGLNIFLFVIIGLYAVLIILAFQLALVCFADRLFVRTADWRITEVDRTVHLAQYHLPMEAADAYRVRFGKDLVAEVKRDIYDRTFARGLEPTRSVCVEVLSKYGLPEEAERLRLRAIDVYGLVQGAAGKFGLPMPKVTVSNSMVANAAATGPGPKHGVMILTTGLLIQLEEDEILNVVGHELGHLAGRDPLMLFGLTSAELLLRLFIFLPLVLFSPILYLAAALGIVYFIAKFFEARADLLAAIRIGQPQVLAEALRKIGFFRLREERLPPYRLMGWLRWDPHPPLYFRIDRLESMGGPPHVPRPLAQSAKDVFRGFAAALKT
jgi:heat shock protein HtpX